MADEKCLNGTGLRAVIDWILSAFTKKKDFDALEIGGRNLIVQSSLIENGRLQNSFNTTEYIYKDNGYLCTDKIYVNNKESYTISCKKNLSGYLSLGYFSEDNIYLSRPIMITNLTEPYDSTIIIPENISYIRVSFHQDDVKFVKLEKGNKATDWTPAPEDVETAISDVTNDCIKGLSVSDKTITYTKGDGSKGTITTQDTNTWRGIQNNLTSDSTTDSLAAAQGKALKKLVDGKAASSHKHTKSDITDMPTSLPANGGNADMVDGKHASDIYKHLSLKDASEVSPNERGCFSVNLVGTSLGWLNVAQFDQGHFISQLGFEINSYYNTVTVWARSRYANNSFADWNSGWHRLGTDVVIGTSMGTIAYKSDYSKALIEFWKTTVGSASRTVYDSAIITGLSSSMTAVNGQIVSNGADFAFVYSISAGGAITPSGNFTKYKITYFN